MTLEIQPLIFSNGFKNVRNMVQMTIFCPKNLKNCQALKTCEKKILVEFQSQPVYATALCVGNK